MIIIINYTTFRKITFNYITKYQKISTHFHFPLGASYSQQKGAVLCEGNGKDGSLTTSRTKHENLSRENKAKTCLANASLPHDIRYKKNYNNHLLLEDLCMQHMKVDCLTNPKALPASKEEQPTKKIQNINNLQGLRRAMRNNTQIKTAKTTIKIPFYPRIQLQEAAKAPIKRENYSEEVNNLKDLNKT